MVSAWDKVGQDLNSNSCNVKSRGGSMVKDRGQNVDPIRAQSLVGGRVKGLGWR